MNGIDFRSMSREELLSEIEKRDELIANMKAELHKYRNQDVANARKIAVSAETATSSDRKVIQKDQHTWDIIESAFLTNDFLCQLEKQQMDEMIESMHQVDVPADSIVIRQGDHGSLLYVLEDGKLQVTKDNRLLRIMDAPCVFGELAILYHCERTASVKALTPCRLWAIERSIFHSIMVNSAKTKHDSLFKFLKRCRRFVQFPDERLHTLADLAKEEHWPFRTEITPNQIAAKVLVVTQGRLILRRSTPSSTPELHTLVPGDVFGEIDELFSAVHNPNPGSYLLHSSTNFRQTPRGERYFVDSVDGCTLLTMLVEQICRKFQSTALIDDNAVQPTKSLFEKMIEYLIAVNRFPDYIPQHYAELEKYVKPRVQKRSGVPKTPPECENDEKKSFRSLRIFIQPLVNTTLKSDVSSRIELPDLKTIATLGVGGFGRVNLVKHIDTEKVYALKVLNKAHIKEMNQQEHVINERHILMSCKNDFIVRLVKTFRDPERLYMLMEYCPGGEVWTMLRNWGRFDENTARYYCAVALEAFDYLHRRFIIYRDLKPENMLLDKNGFPKLADFGFAKRLKSESDRTWTFCGTAEYVAPEIILNKGQDIAVDIWALGIFMYELIYGTPPFASTDPMHTYNSILKGVQSLLWPKFMSQEAINLICKFCRREPTQRLGYGCIEDARTDPWFKDFDFEAFRSQKMRPPIKPKVRSSTDTQNFDRYPSADSFPTGIDESGWDADF